MGKIVELESNEKCEEILEMGLVDANYDLGVEVGKSLEQRARLGNAVRREMVQGTQVGILVCNSNVMGQLRQG